MASFLGIDISKETFHASLLTDRGEAHEGLPEHEKGFEQLIAWLRNRQASDVMSVWRRRARIGKR